MSTRQDHLKFIKEKGKFAVDCNHGSFSTEEIEMLEKYGHWFNALTSGTLEPFTDTQKRFISVAEGKEDPFSLQEAAWWKYLDQIAYEARHRDGIVIQYDPQDDTFYSRNMFKQQKATMRKVIKDNHRN